MKKVLKWIAILILAVVVIAAVSAFIIIRNVDKRTAKAYEISPLEVTIPSDSLSLVRGKELSVICSDCHNADLGGKMFFNDPTFGSVYSANLTSGKGGIGSSYSDADWVRSIRHGVDPNKRPLLIMPAHDYVHMGKKDLECLIAYLKQMPPVDRAKEAAALKPIAKVFAGLGMFGDFLSAESIDHKSAFEEAPEPAESVVYGEYMVKISGCRTCHNQNLAGGKSPDPSSPPVSNITSGGPLAKWSADEFVQTMKTGTTPDGRKLDNKHMPWVALGMLPEMHQKAIYKYLMSVPAAQPAE